MHQSDGWAGPAHDTGQAQPLNRTPRPQQPNVDLTSPTFGSVSAAETNMRFLRAGGQIEWLIIMTVVPRVRHGRPGPTACASDVFDVLCGPGRTWAPG